MYLLTIRGGTQKETPVPNPTLNNSQRVSPENRTSLREPRPKEKRAGRVPLCILAKIMPIRLHNVLKTFDFWASDLGTAEKEHPSNERSIKNQKVSNSRIYAEPRETLKRWRISTR